jgi:hypothetical protein
MKIKQTLIVITILGCLFACKKWKEPTDVNFFVDIEKSATLGGQLTFTGGQINIEYIDFDGDREKGDGVHFTKDFNNGLLIPFNESQSIAGLEFVIPQGEYNRIDIEFKTVDDNGAVCILVEGNYVYAGGGSIPFRFEFTDSKQFKIRAEYKNGGNILLDKDISSSAKIVLDPNYWFQPVPTSYFENADVSNISGINTILINKDNNDLIYDIVLNRLDESAIVVFN